MAKFLYFDPESNNALSVPADRLLSMDQVGDTEIRLTFEEKDGVTNSRTFVTLNIEAGKEKQVMDAIAKAIANGARDASIVICDDTNDKYVSSHITSCAVQAGAVSSSGVMAPGSGATGATYKSSVKRVGDLIETTVIVDLEDLASVADDAKIVGTDTDANAYVIKLDSAINGSVYHLLEMTCVEAIEGGEPNLIIQASATGTTAAQGAVATPDLLADTTSDIALGAQTRTGLNAAVAPTVAKPYLYLANGAAASTAATYTGGKLMIRILGEV